jgi:hypothetical protein
VRLDRDYVIEVNDVRAVDPHEAAGLEPRLQVLQARAVSRGRPSRSTARARGRGPRPRRSAWTRAHLGARPGRPRPGAPLARPDLAS